ncbi:Ig-like domain-containing protein [Leptospira ilyithenensis]|uniref:SbsA Ig-like domain-containing protein n=1 Tax=Leptospira ilyithenensis TaxID=2484901 RepID=A0A4R9LU66_9LEPT|nr:Ig-like domain-containing protein [Leptospira ilyithenensis]TGN14252.1 hypothetical protein EHS11_01880 [Leptospira ilyithenensis]
MKANSSNLSVRKSILISLLSAAFLLVLFCQCLMNPAVQSVTNPPKETTSPIGFLALFAGGATTSAAAFQVSGQLKNLNGNSLSGTTLSASSASGSVRNTAVSVTTTTNGAGRFLLNLPIGITKISVMNSSGLVLGSFNLTLSADSVVQTTDSNSQFNVSNIEKHELGVIVTLSSDDSSTVPVPSLISSSPENGNTSVALNGIFQAIFILTFNTDMDSSTINSSTVTVPGRSVSVIANTSREYIATISELSNDTDYVITLSSEIKDLIGNSLSTTTINFRTMLSAMQL